MTMIVPDVAILLADTHQSVGLVGDFRPAERKTVYAIQQQLDLPHDFTVWYTTMAPHNVEIPAYGDRPILENYYELPQALRGYRFDANTGVEIPEWDKTCLVFGRCGKYPLIARTAQTHDLTIYYGTPTKRSWQLTPLSDDLASFLIGLSAYVRLYVTDYQCVIHDIDFVLKPQFWADFSEALDRHPGTTGLAEAWLSGWLGY